MAVKTPSVGQIAFKGNVRRAMQKIISGQRSLAQWILTHQDWPVVVLTGTQQRQLAGIASQLFANLTVRVPPAPPQ
jgi:hypothetical protein